MKKMMTMVEEESHRHHKNPNYTRVLQQLTTVTMYSLCIHIQAEASHSSLHQKVCRDLRQGSPLGFDNLGGDEDEGPKAPQGEASVHGGQAELLRQGQKRLTDENVHHPVGRECSAAGLAEEQV